MWKFEAFSIQVEAIIYLLLYNVHDCTFNGKLHFLYSVYSVHVLSTKQSHIVKQKCY